MAFQSLVLKPGVNADYTPMLNQGSYDDANLIRFRDGMPEKLGGWAAYTTATLASPIRCLHAWQDLSSARWLGVGAEENLIVVEDQGPIPQSNYQDLTPQYRVIEQAPSFSTTNGSNAVAVDATGSALTQFDSVYIATPVSVGGLILKGLYPINSAASVDLFTILAASNASATVAAGGDLPVFDASSGTSEVTVTFPDHGLSVGQEVYFELPTTVGGITIQGLYTVYTVPSADEFHFIAQTVASSTATETMNGGNVYFQFWIAKGPITAGGGWGLGDWGEGAWGLGTPTPTTPGTPITTTNWSIDNWGQIMLACPKGGALYQWTPSSGYGTASIVTTAPRYNNGIFVAMPQQILVCWGTTVASTGAQDPLYIRWSNVSDYTDFTPTTTNQAGGYRIPEGSEIIGALQTSQQALFWTDIGLWSMMYVGEQFVFGFNKIGDGCGLIGMHACATINGQVFWMSRGNFFTLNGGAVVPMVCPVWDYVFQDIDLDNASKCVAAANSVFDEVAFYYPSLSGGTGEIDRYVKFNLKEQVWDFGRLARSAWIDTSVLGYPIGGTPTGQIFQHEVSPDANGAAMEPSIRTGWIMISDGQMSTFVDLLMPDFKYGYRSVEPEASSARVDVLVETANWPDLASVLPKGPYTFTSASRWANTRVRGRMVRFTFSSNDIGTWWRLGRFRYRGAADGAR